VGGGGSFNHSSCPLGKGDANASCEQGRTALLDELEGAMDLLIQQKPQIFDLGNEYAPGTRAYKVLDKEAYMEGLVANLRAAGLCSERDPDDFQLETIRAKNASDFSEDFDVILSSGHMRRGSGMYRQTCSPSAFPVDRSEDAPPIGSGCGRPYPPPVTRFNCKLHLKGNEFYTLDSTPIVGPDIAYCSSIGFTDGRSLVPCVRREPPTGWRARTGAWGRPRTPAAPVPPGRSRTAASAPAPRAGARTTPTTRPSCSPTGTGPTSSPPRTGPAAR
jgi:hypothetical protein